MTPDQHGFTRCASCGVWFRGDHAPDTSECWSLRHQRAVHKVRAEYPLAFHLPECTARTTYCDCFEKQRAARASKKVP